MSVVIKYLTIDKAIYYLNKKANYNIDATELRDLCRQLMLFPTFYFNGWAVDFEDYDKNLTFDDCIDSDLLPQVHEPFPVQGYFNDLYISDGIGGGEYFDTCVPLCVDVLGHEKLRQVILCQKAGLSSTWEQQFRIVKRIPSDEIRISTASVKKLIDNGGEIEISSADLDRIFALFDKLSSNHTIMDKQREYIIHLRKKLEAFQINKTATTHTTLAMQVMSEVIEEFWIDFDPEQSAPPKQEIIKRWIIDKFEVSPALALCIDKVCRDDKAKAGGKYKK